LHVLRSCQISQSRSPPFRIPTELLFYRVLLYCLSKSPVNEPTSRCPNGASMEGDARLQSLPFSYPSEFPVKGPRPGSQTGPLWRELPVSRAFFYVLR
jgi:hypothetical protein